MITPVPHHPLARRLIAATILLTLVVSSAALTRPAAAETPAQTLVTAAYRDLLGRDPEPDGLAFWSQKLEDGVAAGTVVAAIGDAPEQRRLVVTTAYSRVFGRSPDPAGLNFWSADIINRSSEADLYVHLFSSREYFLTNGNTNRGYVSALYADILNRSPEPGGLDYWTRLLDGETDRSTLARLLLDSVESVGQPALSVVRAFPSVRSETNHLGRITIDLDRPVDADRSAIIVSANGIRVPGLTGAGSSTSQIRFTPTGQPSGLRTGLPVNVVVTVFAYDGLAFDRVDYTYTLRPTESFSTRNELIVAFYGHAKTPVLGILGEGTPAEALAGLLAQAAPYQSGHRPVVPAFELIATLVTATPGEDGLYRARTDASLIEPYLDEIRTVSGYLILDLQPGRGDLEDEARYYEDLLLNPEVGLALDPEWKIGPDESPKGHIGTIDAAEINRVSEYLSALVLANRLPDKILVVHRFRPDMITNPDRVASPPGVIIVFQADGEGSPEAKVGDYDTLLPARFGRGFKVFYDEDHPALSPEAVMGLLNPAPDYLSYQ